MIRKIVKNTIEKHQLIEKHQHIVLGLSGGPDSVCLFYILNSLAEEMDLKLYPVHINHKFRPGAAEADQAYAEKLSETMGWPCRSFVYDCNALAAEGRMTGEEAGRKVRYDSFAAVCRELKDSGIPQESIRIAVAQNADDQAETILFRILRGTGTDGLSGISYKRKDEEGNLIIRPLLDAGKKEILDYCMEHGLNPQTDHTNFEPVYTRNKIRLELIPYLEREYNQSIKDTLIRMGKTAAQDRDFLWQQAREAFDDAVISRDGASVLLKGEKVKSLHRAVRQRVLSLAFGEIGLTDDVTFAHFEGCEEIISNEKPSARVDLPKGYYLTKVYDDIKAARAGSGKSAQSDNRNHRKNFNITIMTQQEYEEKREALSLHAAFDYDRMENTFGPGFEKLITLEPRRAGDYLTIGKDKTKKIQDYFIDQKVPKDERENIPLLKIGSEVLWIWQKGGKGRFSFNFKLCEDTKKVICIEIFC